MKTFIRYAGIIYITQAAAGFVIGFAIPWLRLFGFI